jgi:hypothetical protein
MTKLRLATFALGAAIVAVAFLPALAAAQVALLPVGTMLLGLATRWPQDQPPPPPP